MIRKALLLLAASMFSLSAHAQFSVYGMATLDRMSGISSSPVLQTLSPLPCSNANPPSPCTSYKDTVNPIGFTAGLTYGFKTVGPVRLSADLRGVVENNHEGAQTYSQGAGTRIDSFLGGLRGSFHTPISFLNPYGQVSVGYARSNYGVLTNAQVQTTTTYPGIPTQNNLEYHVFAGLDVRALPLLDFRAVELGYGALHSSGNFGHSYPILSISTGLVFHFPPRP